MLASALKFSLCLSMTLREHMRVVSVYIVCVCMCVHTVCMYMPVEFFREIHFHINEASVSSTSVS